MPIEPIRFYYKGFQTVIPRNNVDSDGSEDEAPSTKDDHDDHVLVEAHGQTETNERLSTSSDDSETRWPRDCAINPLVIPKSPEREGNNVGLNRCQGRADKTKQLKAKRITRFTMTDRYQCELLSKSKTASGKENKDSSMIEESDQNETARNVNRCLFKSNASSQRVSVDRSSASKTLFTSSPYAEGKPSMSATKFETVDISPIVKGTREESDDSQFYQPVLSFSERESSDSDEPLQTYVERKKGLRELPSEPGKEGELSHCANSRDNSKISFKIPSRVEESQKKNPSMLESADGPEKKKLSPTVKPTEVESDDSQFYQPVLSFSERASSDSDEPLQSYVDGKKGLRELPSKPGKEGELSHCANSRDISKISFKIPSRFEGTESQKKNPSMLESADGPEKKKLSARILVPSTKDNVVLGKKTTKRKIVSSTSNSSVSDFSQDSIHITYSPAKLDSSVPVCENKKEVSEVPARIAVSEGKVLSKASTAATKVSQPKRKCQEGLPNEPNLETVPIKDKVIDSSMNVKGPRSNQSKPATSKDRIPKNKCPEEERPESNSETVAINDSVIVSSVEDKGLPSSQSKAATKVSQPKRKCQEGLRYEPNLKTVPIKDKVIDLGMKVKGPRSYQSGPATSKDRIPKNKCPEEERPESNLESVALNDSVIFSSVEDKGLPSSKSKAATKDRQPKNKCQEGLRNEPNLETVPSKKRVAAKSRLKGKAPPAIESPNSTTDDDLPEFDIPEEDISAPMWREGDIQEKVLEPHPPFSTPLQEKDPVEYFLYYFDEAILSLIVEQTNLYSTQQDVNKNVGLTIGELKLFMGILLYMGVVSLPSMEDYWSMSTYVKQVAEVMSSKRFQKIRSHLHFVDNTQEPGTDPFRKVRPLLDHIRAKLKNLEQESTLSADEGMIGYKGKYAGSLRQYMPNKPSSKWGFKFFGLAGISGMLYDFILYSGSQTFSAENLLPEEKNMGVGAMAIIALTKNIKHPRSTTLTFDNWYTGIPLINYLQTNLNICSLGTIKSNRMEDCPLTSEKDLLRTKKRGYCESQVSKTGVIVMKWVDNKVVSLAGTRVGVNPIGAVMRWDKSSKARVLVNIPRAILTYNASMGGVDLSDQYRAMLSTPTRAKRWYFPLFGFVVDLAICNGFILYKRDCELLGIKSKIQKLKDFRLAVSHALMAPSQRSRGRPSLKNAALSRKEVRRPLLPRPVDDIRTDGYNHWIVSDTQQKRCRYCSSYTRSKCTKCEIHLCFVVSKDSTKSRNCFTQFHLQKNIVRKKKKDSTPDNTVESDDSDKVDGDLTAPSA